MYDIGPAKLDTPADPVTAADVAKVNALLDDATLDDTELRDQLLNQCPRWRGALWAVKMAHTSTVLAEVADRLAADAREEVAALIAQVVELDKLHASDAVLSQAEEDEVVALQGDVDDAILRLVTVR